MAAAFGNVEIIQILLAGGADINNVNNEGVGIKEAALRMGHREAAAFIEKQKEI